MQTLVSAGAPIRYIEPVSHSLEDVYLELVGSDEEGGEVGHGRGSTDDVQQFCDSCFVGGRNLGGASSAHASAQRRRIASRGRPSIGGDARRP